MISLYRVVGPTSVCGVVVDGDRIVEAAPYLQKSVRSAGWSWRRFLERIWHGWTVERVS